jgi:DMSO/TMAO reductase YedYZ molybdopterin-dependent catalytic subunit
VPDRDLLVLSEEPLNAETKLDERTGAITPAGSHYVRTHFPLPHAPDRFAVGGAVSRPISIAVDEIRAMPRRTLPVTLECAGNGRRFMDPKVPGEQWGLGAVGTAVWTGTPLRTVLEQAAPEPKAVEVLFRGADEGVPKDLGKQIAYERSLPLADALSDDVLVAYLMNGEPVPPEHGGPLRLIVPGWYGMASVKWLSRISLLEEPFVGFYQTDRYIIERQPLRHMAPRAVITSPVDGAEVSGARLEIRGYAWSGAGGIQRVQVAAQPAEFAGEPYWREAELGPTTSAFSWGSFSLGLLIDSQSDRTDLAVMARAIDPAGNTQPLEQQWNALGYANNAARPVRIRVRS